jgi:hypothetical protein
MEIAWSHNAMNRAAKLMDYNQFQALFESEMPFLFVLKPTHLVEHRRLEQELRH